MFSIKQHKAELEALCDFTEIYDTFRLVNPFTNQIFALKNGKAIAIASPPCYEIWHRATPCQNCVSLRACRDKKQYIKLEELDDRILIIVSKPVTIQNQLFSLELAKDVTESMLVRDGLHHEQTQITQLISQFKQMSITDLFTGLYNNAYIQNKINEFAQTQNGNFAIIILDIDKFKQVNDQYGHLAGDIVIKEIANVLRKFAPLPEAFAGRMGGDEYCVVFANCNLNQANQFAHRIAQQINQHQYQGQHQTFSVEVSIGVGEYQPNESTRDFIERVDSAMYKIKKGKAATRL